MAVEFKPQGYYSLLAVKNTPGFIGTRSDGTSILPVSGGCNDKEYCTAASTTLKNIIDMTANEKNDRKPTRKKQKIYRGFYKKGLVVIPTNEKHAKESDNIWVDREVRKAIYG